MRLASARSDAKNSAELDSALAGLSTPRIQALLDYVESQPDVELTVSGWYPRCPMKVAGFDPGELGMSHQFGSTPEHRFAFAWDRFARPAHPRWWHALFHTPCPARRSDIQALIRAANAVLAGRGAPTAHSGEPRPASYSLA